MEEQKEKKKSDKEMVVCGKWKKTKLNQRKTIDYTKAEKENRGKKTKNDEKLRKNVKWGGRTRKF